MAIKPGQQRVFTLPDLVAAKVYTKPEQDQVEAWIDTYGVIGEYVVADIPFYCRPLSRGEYRLCTALAVDNESLLNDALCQRATLWPLNFDFTADDIQAGIPSGIGQRIRELSGFTSESRDRIFHHWQEKSYDQDERRDMLIEIAYPHFSHADLDNMLADDYYHYLAKAEFRIRTQLLTSTNPEFNPDELVDLLLMSRANLEARLDAARDSVDAIMAEQRMLESQQRAHDAKRMRLGGGARNPGIAPGNFSTTA